MSYMISKLAQLAPVFGALTLLVPHLQAAEVSVAELPDNAANSATSALANVTSVSQLSDVSPTDWAFQALQSLVERYGCIAGYPNQTYRGSWTISRYEFAAGLNACIDRVNELIAAATSDSVSKDDLATLKTLQNEFAAELAILRGRVDSLEARTKTLEAQQFSTTTKLSGEVIFGFAKLFGDDRADGDNDHSDLNASNVVLNDRVRLNFDTSFTGRDRLRVRLEAGNAVRFNSSLTGTDSTRLGFDAQGGNAVETSVISYRFPVGKHLTVFIAPFDESYRPNEGIDVASLWPYLESGGSGSISRFGRINPIYRQGGDGGHFAIAYDITDKLTFSGGYFVSEDNVDNPANGGLFNGTYTARAHLTFEPTRDLAFGVGYSRSYFAVGNGLTGSTGSGFANNPFNGAGTSANTYTAEARYRINRGFIIAGYATFIDAEARTGVNRGRNAEIFGYAVSLVFPNLITKGSVGGLIVGQPPKASSNDLAFRQDPDTSLHLEAFYRYQLTDNISITPGVFWITNPNHNSNNDSIIVTTIRTTFRF